MATSLGKRQSNIELLRILSMLMIIGHHLSYYSGMSFDISTITVNRVWAQMLSYGGHVGVDVFVLISGYFMIEQKGLKLSKLARVWLQLLFYSVGLYIFAVCFLGVEYESRLLIRYLFPFMYYQWTFASAYFELMIVAPFINILLRNLTKKQFRLMLAVFGILWVVIPMICSYGSYTNYFIWLVVVYSIGAYIKLYPDDFSRSAGFYLGATAIVALLCYMATIVADIIGFRLPIFAEHATHFTGMQHINIVLWSVLLFLGFLKLRIPYIGFINYVATFVFGVYLIHDDFYIREYIWKSLTDNRTMSGKALFIPYTVLEIAGIFIACAFVELLRQNLLERWYMKLVNKLVNKPQQKLNEIL